jgi:hypothetical protein
MVRWRANGDKGSKDFYQACRPKSTLSSYINRLTNHLGVVQTDQTTMEHIGLEFYSALYNSGQDTTSTATIQQWALVDFHSLLSQQVISALERPPNLSELTKALSYMANDKLPSLDGITTEFYKCLWDECMVE